MMMAAELYEPGGHGREFLAWFPWAGRVDGERRGHGRRAPGAARSMPCVGEQRGQRDTMMPLPVAVARCSWKRSMAATRSSRLCVGGCTTWAVPAKATMPTRTLRGSSARKALAASCDATSGWA
jgi:hypothetical protein